VDIHGSISSISTRAHRGSEDANGSKGVSTAREGGAHGREKAHTSKGKAHTTGKGVHTARKEHARVRGGRA
jgi:hypothetical protein